jgi:hypothetical protein
MIGPNCSATLRPVEPSLIGSVHASTISSRCAPANGFTNPDSQRENRRQIGLRRQTFLPDHPPPELVQFQVDCGAAISDADLSVLDLKSAARFFEGRFESIVIQGHSFGTNIVKNFVRRNRWEGNLVFLSPSDSSWLYEEWRSRHASGAQDSQREWLAKNGSLSLDDSIVFGIFGIGVKNTDYPIPMSIRGLRGLFSSQVFSEWSKSTGACSNECLVVFGQGDDIAQSGRTASDARIRDWLPMARIERIAGASHLFRGMESALIHTLIQRWKRQ